MLRTEGKTKGFARLNNLGIGPKQHKKYSNLWLFVYDQIDSPAGDPIVRECRGTILDEVNDWAVISFPFKRFFNLGECHADKIDWTTAEVFKKEDGSLAVLYYYDNKWHVQTKGTPDASGQVYGNSFTFAELFWQTFETQFGLKLLKTLPHNLNFMFELMSQYNRVVVRHEKATLSLLAVRNLATLIEHPARDWPNLNPVQSFPLFDVKTIEATFPAMDPMKQEGYVVVDADFNRVKVKNPAYVAIHRLRDGMCQRRLLELIQSNEQSEFLIYFPEYTEEYNKVFVPYEAFVRQTEEAEQQLSSMLNDGSKEATKAYALEAQKVGPGQHALFAVRRGYVSSVKEYIRNMRSKQLLQVLGLKNQVMDVV